MQKQSNKNESVSCYIENKVLIIYNLQIVRKWEELFFICLECFNETIPVFRWKKKALCNKKLNK
mgnify:CR=1 FL=1